MASPAYSILFSAYVSPTASSGGAGDVLIPDVTTGYYVLATTANRGARRSTGIALAPYAAGSVVEIQQEGQVSAATSGLGAGTASLVRVSTAGALERVASPGATDDVVGWCETDGTLHLRCGQSPGGYGYGAAGFTAPTGTGFVSVTGGALDAASTKVNLASATYVTGTLPVGNGGTGITSLGTGVATFLGTPSGANLGSALTSALAANKVVQATGTGIPHVVAGVLSAASSLIVDADVSGSAAIAVSKLAPSGTNGWVLTTTAGVPVWAAAAGGGTPGGSTGEIQYNNAGSLGGATDILAGAGFISYGANGGTLATSGVLRLGGTATQISWNSANRALLATDEGAGTVAFGPFAAGLVTYQGYTATLDGFSTANLANQGTIGLQFDGVNVLTRYPTLGLSSPYSVHGAVTYAFASNANYTLAATEYVYDWISFNVGAWTAGRTVTFPNVASLAAAYTKTVFNNTGFTMTISNGGTTKTLATGLAQRFLFGVSAVSFASPTWTP